MYRATYLAIKRVLAWLFVCLNSSTSVSLSVRSTNKQVRREGGKAAPLTSSFKFTSQCQATKRIARGPSVRARDAERANSYALSYFGSLPFRGLLFVTGRLISPDTAPAFKKFDQQHVVPVTTAHHAECGRATSDSVTARGGLVGEGSSLQSLGRTRKAGGRGRGRAIENDVKRRKETPLSRGQR